MNWKPIKKVRFCSRPRRGASIRHCSVCLSDGVYFRSFFLLLMFHYSSERGGRTLAGKKEGGKRNRNSRDWGRKESLSKGVCSPPGRGPHPADTMGFCRHLCWEQIFFCTVPTPFTPTGVVRPAATHLKKPAGAAKGAVQRKKVRPLPVTGATAVPSPLRGVFGVKRSKSSSSGGS